LQWLQIPSKINGDNLNNIRHEAIRHFRNKKRENLKDKINKLLMHSKNKNTGDLHGGINEFKKGYQLRTNLVKDVNSYYLSHSEYLLTAWKNCFSQLLNVHSYVRQMEIQRSHWYLSFSPLEAEIVVTKLKKI
jgi:NAD+--asparagine ADP-ribosyltransferase